MANNSNKVKVLFKDPQFQLKEATVVRFVTIGSMTESGRETAAKRMYSALKGFNPKLRVYPSDFKEPFEEVPCLVWNCAPAPIAMVLPAFVINERMWLTDRIRQLAEGRMPREEFGSSRKETLFDDSVVTVGGFDKKIYRGLVEATDWADGKPDIRGFTSVMKELRNAPHPEVRMLKVPCWYLDRKHIPAYAVGYFAYSRPQPFTFWKAGKGVVDPESPVGRIMVWSAHLPDRAVSFDDDRGFIS